MSAVCLYVMATNTSADRTDDDELSPDDLTAAELFRLLKDHPEKQTFTPADLAAYHDTGADE